MFVARRSCGRSPHPGLHLQQPDLHPLDVTLLLQILPVVLSRDSVVLPGALEGGSRQLLGFLSEGQLGSLPPPLGLTARAEYRW